MTTVGRLRGRRTFAALAQQGRTVRQGPVRVRFLDASDDEIHVGYAISKAAGGSVVRNRIRRRIKAAIAGANMPLTSGFYLISADARVATMAFTELTDALAAAVANLTEAHS